MPLTHTIRTVGRLAALVAIAAVAATLMLADDARADFGIQSFSAELTNADGSPATQAGSHPYEFRTEIEFNQHLGELGFSMVPDANLRDVSIDLPIGFVGNPEAVPQCEEQQLQDTAQNLACPASTQVGVVTNVLTFWGPLSTKVYNMVPPDGIAAQLAFNIVGAIVHVNARLRDDGSYGVTVDAQGISAANGVLSTEMTLWGFPADTRHDTHRGQCFADGGPLGGQCPSDAPKKAFLTLPTDCSAGPQVLTLRASSWQQPNVVETASIDEDVNGVPFEVEGCGNLPFDPSISLEPETSEPDAPTGLDVEVAFPQEGLTNPLGLATAHLKDARVALPEGMTINPASADGLVGCTDAQISIDSLAPAQCPPASRIGTASAESPLVSGGLSGAIYVGTQRSDDPESGEMFRVFMVLENDQRGLRVKLPGAVRANAATGRLETTFGDNPQLPVSTIRLAFKGGPRAPLATPATCGTKTTTAELASWAGHLVGLSDSFDVPCGATSGFAPSFGAGSVIATGGGFSPFAVRIERPDRQGYLSGVSVDLPPGLLAKLRGVPLCGSPAAADGGCPEGSRVGTATVGAGSGSNPFYLQGPVYLSEGYKGAPYGLAVHVHAKAGPYDLGWVRVRQALFVDPETAEASVVSDPLPQIVKGVPIRLRSVNVDVDRPGFMVNPTSCSEKRIEATLTSVDGAVHRTGSRFQVGDCRALAFRPKLGLRLVGKGRMRSGGHPALRASLRQGSGQANIKAAKVTLPRNVVLDSKNAFDPASLCGYDAALKADCPASSVIGRASASSPLLNRPLSGPVHLVQGIRFGATGNRIRTLPTLLVKLRGEIAINLRSKTSVDGSSRLVSTFPAVPDAAVSRFSLQINGGRKGILVVTENRRGRINLCARKQTALVETDGHNGKRADYPTRVKTPCAKKGKRKR